MLPRHGAPLGPGLYGEDRPQYALRMPPLRYAYFHGFRSSPSAKKGLHLRDTFGPAVDFLLPDLNRPSFAKLSVGAMLAHLEWLHEEEGRPAWRIVGSSLGGWLAARWAELHPERVDRLVLLCPAFDLAHRWPEMMDAGDFERWQRDGEIETEDASGAPARLHFAFYEEASREAQWPRVRCPVTVVHGTRDETVPIASSRRWVPEQANARLIEVDDTHDLLASLDVVDRAVRDTFGIG